MTDAAPGPVLWGGRFSGGPAAAMLAYTTSLPVDRRLYREDIAGSVAHVRMLGAAGIIATSDAQALARGLQAVRREMDSGAFTFVEADEDIHSAVERRLHEMLGPELAGKLHTGRSRNDQVALDMRMFAKGAIVRLGDAVARLQAALLKQAETHRASVMPAFTHMQRAQPTTLGHHLLAYVAMLQRDFDRLQDAYDRADIMPLGSGAATGSGLPLKREYVAKELGFTAISQNSLDAVSDRDFVIEIEAACALVMLHLSRLAEELVLWSGAEFGIVELPDEYATGSSLMPQKKNPDVPELVRGRAGRVVGALVGMMMAVKGLPLAYNRDLQEDKAGFFDAVDTTEQSLQILARMLPRVGFDRERMAELAADPALVATDVADYLVAKGIPFREAHGVVGKAVKKAASRRTTLAGLDLEQWQALHPAFDDGVLGLFDPVAALARRQLVGSPGPAPLRRAIVRALVAVRRNTEWLRANRVAY